MAKKTKKELVVDQSDPEIKDIRKFIQGTPIVNLINAYTKQIELLYENGWMTLDVDDGKTPVEFKYGSLRNKTLKGNRGIEFDYKGIYKNQKKLMDLWVEIHRIIGKNTFWEEVKKKPVVKKKVSKKK